MHHSVSMKILIGLGILFLAGAPLLSCQHGAIMEQQQSIEIMLNNGQHEHHVALDEEIVINSQQEQPKWEVSLGRHDSRSAIFKYFDNKSQASVKFTQAGTYQVNLGSHRGGGQNAAMMVTLTLVVQ